MTWQRFLNASIALIGLVLPLVIACIIIFIMMPDPPDAVPTPNPKPAPHTIFLYGPADYLVYFDPWFAGTALFWFELWYLIGALYVLGVTLAWPFVDKPPYNRIWALGILSLTIGFVAASPWWYCLLGGKIAH